MTEKLMSMADLANRLLDEFAEVQRRVDDASVGTTEMTLRPRPSDLVSMCQHTNSGTVSLSVHAGLYRVVIYFSPVHLPALTDLVAALEGLPAPKEG